MIIGIIPARGGSKGIPKKNIKLLLGKPLIVWSIEAALQSTKLDSWFVSTDDPEIAGIAVSAGASVIMRPPELATDDSTTLEVLRYHYCGHWCPIGDASVVVLLQPTSPVRDGRLIDTAIRRFIVTEADTLATGYMSTHGDWLKTPHGPRQKQEAYFHDDGNIYIFKKEVLESNRWVGDTPHKMIIEPKYNLEIDTLADFWAAEGILKNVTLAGTGG